MTIKETQTFTTATNTDFSTQVNALVASGVKVVFIPIYAEEASTFLTQAKGKFGVGCLLLRRRRSGRHPGQGQPGCVHRGQRADDDPLCRRLCRAPRCRPLSRRIRTQYNATPDQFAADAYDAVYAVKAAMEAARRQHLRHRPGRRDDLPDRGGCHRYHDLERRRQYQ